MRNTSRAISIFALISACFGGAFANARLPVVNSGNAVSARALFGEAPVATAPAQPIAIAKPTPVSEQRAASAPKVAARPAAIGDILMPNRPNGNIWARSSEPAIPTIARASNVAAPTPLRMPESHEFAMLRDDFILPEESLDTQIVRMQQNARRNNDAELFAGSRGAGIASVPLRAAAPAPAPVPERVAQPMPARVIEFEEPTPRVAVRQASTIENRFVPTQRVATQQPQARATNNDDVFVRRVVVPADDYFDEPVAVRAADTRVARNAHSEDVPLTQMSPMQLKRAFQKTYISENKHLSTYRIDDPFDVASDLSIQMAGFDSRRDLSEAGGIRPLEIKIGFRGNDSALSRDNFNLLSEYAGIVVANPKRAIQVSIPERATRSYDGRKLAARRLAIIEQVLRDTGVSDSRIIPVLSDRADDSFVLRVISSDLHQTLVDAQRDIFGDTISSKTYRSMSW
ncbi:MAG: hypothetical protein FWF34_02900 [Alphaproteobacteria bacterium]|nr:hypothetical protein [Alphaproteobacteria bacterium]MCL2890179.1 hypothetical protein [Alphaproteobacteria bacterium]